MIPLALDLRSRGTFHRGRLLRLISGGDKLAAPIADRKEVDMFVRIIATPPGEAPEAVRRAWIGLDLPLVAAEIGPRVVPTGGVLSGARSWLGMLLRRLTGQTPWQLGYVIDAPQALVLLAQKDPDAAMWWREHAPHCWQPGARFLFHAEVCAEIRTRYVDQPMSARASADGIVAADEERDRLRTIGDAGQAD
jgi:hypothetical protein